MSGPLGGLTRGTGMRLIRSLKGVARRLTWNFPRRQLIGPEEMLVRTRLGFYLVVPPWNLDVAIGVIRDGVIEPWTTEVVAHTLNLRDVFVNVGANFGYYSVLGARQVGRSGAVYAIEANPHIFIYLLKSMFWAGYSDVIRPYQFAAYSRSLPEVTLRFDRQFLGGGSIMGGGGAETDQLVPWSVATLPRMLDERRQWVLRSLETTVKTEGRSLDETIPLDRPVRLMMLDIEGAEPHALLGARELVRRSPGLEVVMEWTPESYRHVDRRPAIDAMWDLLLNECGLKPFRICPEGFRSGRLPRLEPLTRESLFNVPHGDLYLKKAG